MASYCCYLITCLSPRQGGTHYPDYSRHIVHNITDFTVYVSHQYNVILPTSPRTQKKKIQLNSDQAAKVTTIHNIVQKLDSPTPVDHPTCLLPSSLTSLTMFPRTGIYTTQLNLPQYSQSMIPDPWLANKGGNDAKGISREYV